MLQGLAGRKHSVNLLSCLSLLLPSPSSTGVGMEDECECGAWAAAMLPSAVMAQLHMCPVSS